MSSKDIARERIISLIELVYNSYREFEDELGFGRNTVTEWKRGVSTFMDKLPEIADALNVSTDYLLGRETASLIPEIFHIPLIGKIRAGYPVESFEIPKKYDYFTIITGHIPRFGHNERIDRSTFLKPLTESNEIF